MLSKKTVSVSLILFLCKSATLNATELTSGPLACDFSKETSPLVTTEITNVDIEGAILEFPSDYASSRGFKTGKQRRGLLLQADVNDFSSYPKRKRYLEDGTYKGKAGIRDWITILITPFIPLDRVAMRTISFSYENLKLEDEKIDLEGELLANGLRRPRHEIKPTYPKVYFHKNSTGISDIIRCSNVETYVLPSCGHIFEVGAYDVKITYAQSELSRWEELRNGVSNLLQCFTIKEPIELPNIKLPGD